MNGATEWSYGLYMNGQGDDGSFTFKNNEFNGAFRTMLPNINGTVIIEDNKFTNTVADVVNGLLVVLVVRLRVLHPQILMHMISQLPGIHLIMQVHSISRRLKM